MIPALVFVSHSELLRVRPELTLRYIEDNQEEFYTILYELGINTKLDMSIEIDLLHRNRFFEVVQCTRWSGYERLDDAWLNSGHASNEAKDKACNSKLLEDLYNKKGF